MGRDGRRKPMCNTISKWLPSYYDGSADPTSSGYIGVASSPPNFALGIIAPYMLAIAP